MKTRVIWFLLLISSLIQGGCGKDGMDVPYSNAVQEAIRESIEDFSFAQLRSISHSNYSTSSGVISPYGIANYLSLLQNGGDKSFSKRIASSLGTSAFSVNNINCFFNDINHSFRSDSTFNCSCGVWIQDRCSFNERFGTDYSNTFNLECFPNLVFSASVAAEASEWIHNNTGGFFKMDDSVGGTTFKETIFTDKVNVLWGGIFTAGVSMLSASWLFPFSNVDNMTFLDVNDMAISVDAMFFDGSVNCTVNSDVVMVELPLNNSSISMFVYKPYSTTVPLDVISSSLYPQLFQQWVDQCSSKRVDMYIPTFSISTSKYIASSIISTDDFDKGITLSNITDDSFFSFRYRQNYSSIEVNSSGISAGSKATSNGDNCGDSINFAKSGISTSTKVNNVKGVDEQNLFIFNRPFSFIVYDKLTNLVLYAGNYTGRNNIRYFQ